MLRGLCWIMAATAACAPSPMLGPLAGQVPVPGAPAGVTAFVGVNVIPMDTERVLAHQIVLVQNGRITALGPADKLTIPAGAMRIDGQGQYLIPGLADMHAHFLLHDSAGVERELFEGLARGITTIRVVDPYSKIGYAQPTLVLSFKARAMAGQFWSPRIYASVPWAPPQYRNVLDHEWARGHAEFYGLRHDPPPPRLDSVAAYVAAYKAAGYDHIKIYFETGAVFDSLVAAAHRVGMPIIGHSRREAIAARYKSVEHGWDAVVALITEQKMSADSLRAFAATVRRAGVWTCPTLLLSGLRSVNPSVDLQVTKALQDAGAGLLLGTDDGGIGRISDELALLMQAGLTSYQALVTGTRNVAEYFGTLTETGTIAVGKRADLVLLPGNPLEDIRRTAQPAGVMIGGRWLSREAMDRRLAELKPKAGVR